MRIYSGFARDLSAAEKQELFRYRHDVFVRKMGWDLECPEGIESDQFDHEDTYYVVAKSDAQKVVGCARLLPTIRPYLLEEVFPELLQGENPPKSEEVWEVSRMTNQCISRMLETQRSGIQFKALMDCVIECARHQGAKYLVSVSPVAMSKVLAKSGFKLERLMGPKTLYGHKLVVCWMRISVSRSIKSWDAFVPNFYNYQGVLSTTSITTEANFSYSCDTRGL